MKYVHVRTALEISIVAVYKCSVTDRALKTANCFFLFSFSTHENQANIRLKTYTKSLEILTTVCVLLLLHFPKVLKTHIQILLVNSL